MKRWIIAIDSDGTCRLRETLAVTHDQTTGEVRYACKVPRGRVPAHTQEALLAASHVLEFYFHSGLLKRHGGTEQD